MPDPFSNILTGAAGNLAAAILSASTRAARRWLSGDERQNALEACCGAGLSALTASAQTSGKDDESHLHTMFQLAFQNEALVEDFGQELQACLDGKELAIGEVIEIFAEHDRALASFPGLEPEIGLRQLEAAFVMAAVRQPVLQGELVSFHVRGQTQLQTAMLEQLQRIAVQLESLPVQGASLVGVQLLLQSLQVMQRQEAVPVAGDDSVEKARRRYLERLVAECQALPLQQLGGQGDGLGEVQLSDVYVELRTKTGIPLSEADEKLFADEQLRGGREVRILSAQEAAETLPRLVLLGDPGSGKSSFVRHIAARLAKARLDGADTQAWAEDLLPILVVLRDLAPHLAELDLAGKSAERRREALTEALRDSVLELARRSDAQAFEDGLRDALVDGKCLLILDGLDEVRAKLRPLVVEAVQAALQVYRVERVIVTCRVRSYEGDARLPDFEVHELAPFSEEQIDKFIAAWYQAQQRHGHLDADKAQKRTEDLQAAAQDLRELAENPMLLTTMALIHQQNIGLPRQRVKLYDEAVRILLVRWQKRKGLSPDIAEQLGPVLDDEHRIRPILERLAFEVHKAEQEVGRQGADTDEAGLDRLGLLGLLEASTYLGSLSLAEAFLDYVDDRAGILVGRGGGPDEPLRYSFPHRTFQEYLAGCYLTTLPDPVGELFELTAAGDFWTLAVQLGVEELVYCRRMGHLVPRLASGLFPSGTRNKSQKAKRASLWAAWMVVLLEGQPGTQPGAQSDTQSGTQVGSARVSLKGPEPWPKFVSRCWRRLVSLVPKGLPVRERVEAGRLLAKLGDPRPEVMTVEGMEFCRVRRGPFWMGSEETPLHWPIQEAPSVLQAVDYDYWLGRYPVTQSQFQVFVSAGGNRQCRYWGAALEAGYWDEDTGFRGRREPGDVFNEVLILPNHPAIGISWYEALAYCAWLQDEAQYEGWLPEGWVVTLPSELEWEKAARGGECQEIPAVCLPLSELTHECTKLKSNLVTNSQPKRIYPWGSKYQQDYVNGAERLGATNALGNFPEGRSVVGCEEMVGSILEWTRSLAADPPYPSDEKERACRETVESKLRESRVVRSSAWFYPRPDLRCSVRTLGPPNIQAKHLGFRVAICPPNRT